MSNIFLQHLPSSELEARFSVEDGLNFSDNKEIVTITEDDLRPYLNLLPKKEADLLLMYYVLRKDQKEIAAILRLTQGGVSHRIARARSRLKYIIEIPKFKEYTMRKDLAPLFNTIDLDILWGLYKTTCQSQVAQDMNLTQSKVRHRFMKSLKVLEKLTTKPSEKNKKYITYYVAFQKISKNFNILREIKLPKWQSKNLDYIIDESDGNDDDE